VPMQRYGFVSFRKKYLCLKKWTTLNTQICCTVCEICTRNNGAFL
jgi:hypothetical protein